MRYISHWKRFLSTVTVIGAGIFSATASAALTALPASDNPTTKVVTLRVIVRGHARAGFFPGGNVVFTESNTTLGVVSLSGPQVSPHQYCVMGPLEGTECEARLTLNPGYALGPHTITASWSYSTSSAPETLTFTVYVSELAWLPTVLDGLSD